jgi:ClpP class serine protease
MSPPDLQDLFWLFVLLALAQPFLRQRVLERKRRQLIAAIERRRGSRVILLVHRQETMQVFGVPVYRYIDVEDAEQVLRAIRLTDPQIPIDLVLHTPGGLALPTLQIARALDRRPGPVRVLVPHYAMSGGTLIALAADEIVMCEEAVLGPVDPQIEDYPAVSLLRAVANKPIAEVDDETLILADQAEKALTQMSQSVRELLTGKLGEDRADDAAAFLTGGTWAHDYPISVEAARELGLPISTDMPLEVLHLMDLYPQPVRHRPSVEYLPAPRKVTPRRRNPTP